MDFAEIFHSAGLLFVLLNPFLMVVYLIDLVRDLDSRGFAAVLSRAAVISLCVFFIAAALGERLFINVLQVRYASFLIFGGLVFLLIGVRMALLGAEALRGIRGEAEHVAGSIAMPFMIGPGTVNASILTGLRLPLPMAMLTITCGVAASVGTLVLLKRLHDRVRRSKAALVERYVAFVGRISALIVGSIAVEMIITGIEHWLELRTG